MARRNSSGGWWVLALVSVGVALWKAKEADDERLRRIAEAADREERERIIGIITFHFGRIARFLGGHAPPLIFDDRTGSAVSDGQAVLVNLEWIRATLRDHCGTMECTLAFVLAVIAHELAHHVHGDALVPLHIRNSHRVELRADYLSGMALAFFGGDREHVQRIFVAIAPKASASHPAGLQRVAAIEHGYVDGLRRLGRAPDALIST